MSKGRHARPQPRKTIGYHVTASIINVLFAIVLLPIATILLGPVAYGFGL